MSTIHSVKDANISAFPCGRTPHVRHVRSSIVRAIHSIFIPKAMQFFIIMSCDVAEGGCYPSGRATSAF